MDLNPDSPTSSIEFTLSGSDAINIKNLIIYLTKSGGINQREIIGFFIIEFIIILIHYDVVM